MSILTQQNYPLCFSTDQTFETFVKMKCRSLAGGTSREVHSVSGAEFVVKVAKDKHKCICNWTEIAAFFAFQVDQPKLGKIVSWSISGKFIVMEKLDTSTDCPSGFLAPTWVTDTGSKNGGTDADGNYKLCDYALIKSPDEIYQSPFA